MNIYDISQSSETELLNTRLCDLDLDLSSSRLMRGINDLRFELNQKLINFMPDIWLSTDWFSPDGVAGFAIPFYLLHPKLAAIAKKELGSIEGNNSKSFLQLLRHETAHAIDNSFLLRRNKTRQRIFGLTSKPYPHSYLPNPKSRDYVQHLGQFYAQAHPDEDWAETFSVWLDPQVNWRKKYSKWKALEKLEFIDKTFTSIQGQKPKRFIKKRHECISSDSRTLKEFLVEKRAELRLSKSPLIFTNQKAISQFLKEKPLESKKIIRKVTSNSFIINKAIKDFSNECKVTRNALSSKKSNDGIERLNIERQSIEKQLIIATKKYIRTGRHRVIM